MRNIILLALLLPLVSCGDPQVIELNYADDKSPYEFERGISAYPYRDEELMKKISNSMREVHLGGSSGKVVSVLGQPNIHFTAISEFGSKKYETEVLVYVVGKPTKGASDSSDIIAFHIDSKDGLFWIDASGADLSRFASGARDLTRGMYVQYR